MRRIPLSDGFERLNGGGKNLRGGFFQLLTRIISHRNIFISGEEERQKFRCLAQKLHALLHQRGGLREHLLLLFAQLLPQHTRRLQVRYQAVPEISGIQAANMVAVNGFGFFHVETCRVTHHIVHIEMLHQLVHREHVLVC